MDKCVKHKHLLVYHLEPLTSNTVQIILANNDDISNSLGVIVLTDIRSNTQTDTTENNTSLASQAVFSCMRLPGL